jgi:hypothetical protein
LSRPRFRFFLFFSGNWVSAAISSCVKLGFDWRQEADN